MSAWRSLVILLLGGTACAAQPGGPPQPLPDEHAPLSVPFDDWVAAGKRADIPWKVHIFPAELRWNQRLSMSIYVEVSGKKLARQGEQHEIYLMARFGDEHGHWIEEGYLGQRITKPLSKKTDVSFWMPFLVIPGEYKLALVLYDRTTDRRSVWIEMVRVKQLKKDPLVGSLASLPRVQFLAPVQGLERYFNPRLQSRLALPVNTTRPVHFDVVFVLGEFEQRSIRRFTSYNSLGVATSALGVLSQLQIPSVTHHITVADPMRRTIVYEKEDRGRLDMRSMMTAIGQVNPGLISIQALEGYTQYALFLREVLTGRFTEKLPEVAGQRPLKVILVVGSPLIFPRKTMKQPIVAEDESDMLFYHLRYQPFGRRFELFDDFDRVMKIKSMKRFELAIPEDLRRALAEMIAAIEQKSPVPARATAAARPL